MVSRFGVLILAGGKSSRMGYPKAFLRMGKSMMIEHIVDTYSEFTNDINVVLNQEFATDHWQPCLATLVHKVNIIPNQYPEKGRFYSIKLGLAQMKD